MDQVFMELVKEYGTPLYVFDMDVFQKRIQTVAEVLDFVKICYCMKANPFLASEVPEFVSRFEVCSYGEFLLCRQYKIAPERIFYTGVYKEERQIKEAVQYGVRNFSCESRNQLKILDEAAEAMNVQLHVFLRLSSNNQFGMDRADIFDIIARQKEYALHFAGIHYYGVSQKRDTVKVKVELDIIGQLCDEVRQKYGFLVEEIEYGLGLDSDYFQKDPFHSEMQLLKESAVILREFSKKYCVTIEMGRFFAACCGYYLTKVIDMKINGGIRYAIADGGSHQMHYDGQMLGMKIPPVHILEKKTETRNEEWTLCGSLCTHNDLITRKVLLGSLRLGDILCFGYAGAYSVTEGMVLFLTKDIPPVIMHSHEKGNVCVRPRSETVMYNGGYAEGRKTEI